MKFFHRVVLPIVLLAGHLQAAPVPDEARIRDLLGGTSQTSFVVKFCELLASLDASQIPGFHASIAAELGKENQSTPHRRTALTLTEQRWLDLDPKGLLETCAAGRASISLQMQAQALDSLLKKDLEAALKLYLILPLNADFGERCDFFSRLSAIDPARAVRFYFETNECERTFDNPLEISFTAMGEARFQRGMDRRECH